MSPVRKHLRFWVVAWLVFQAVALSALVPRDCCAAHRPVPTEVACHETVGATAHSSSEATVPDSGEECTMRGSCNGPMSALAALLGNQGILTDSSAAPLDARISEMRPAAQERAVSSSPFIEPRPPRA